MKSDLAIAYSMKRKARKMADGGPVQQQQKDKDSETLGKRIGYPGFSQGGVAGAEAEDDKELNQHGEDDEGPDGAYSLGGMIVDKIMSKMGNKTNSLSEGGKVANGSMTEGLAGMKPNEFDDLVLRDDLESSSDGANNGDSIGNEQESSDREDMISRIMSSRAKKDRLPNPR